MTDSAKTSEGRIYQFACKPTYTQMIFEALSYTEQSSDINVPTFISKGIKPKTIDAFTHGIATVSMARTICWEGYPDLDHNSTCGL